MADPTPPADMGVTGNAVLLLGHIVGAFSRDDVYDLEEAIPAAGTMTMRHRVSGNLHRVSVVQVEGRE